MINPAVLIGEPLQFGHICSIYPPKIKDIVAGGAASQYIQVLTMSQDDIADQLKEHLKEGAVPPTPFQFLMYSVAQNPLVNTIAKEAFKFFIHEPVTFLDRDGKIIIGDLESELTKAETINDLRCLSEENFFEFQNALRMAMGEKPQKPPEPIDPNEDPRIRRIKEKARERDRIKKKKGVQGGISLETSLVAICCMGLGINPLNIGEMSYASIGPLMKMMQEKEKYDIDVRSLLAGADSKKIKPKYWIRNSD